MNKANPTSPRVGAGQPYRRVFGWIGVAIALPFFLWAPLGLVPAIPDMIDVFGIRGLRTPAAITIAGLLLGAFGFHEA